VRIAAASCSPRPQSPAWPNRLQGFPRSYSISTQSAITLPLRTVTPPFAASASRSTGRARKSAPEQDIAWSPGRRRETEEGDALKSGRACYPGLFMRLFSKGILGTRKNTEPDGSSLVESVCRFFAGPKGPALRAGRSFQARTVERAVWDRDPGSTTAFAFDSPRLKRPAAKALPVFIRVPKARTQNGYRNSVPCRLGMLPIFRNFPG